MEAFGARSMLSSLCSRRQAIDTSPVARYLGLCMTELLYDNDQSRILSKIVDRSTGQITPEAKQHIDEWLNKMLGTTFGGCRWDHEHSAASATNTHLVGMPAVAGAGPVAPLVCVAITCTLCGRSEMFNVMRVFGHLAK